MQMFTLVDLLHHSVRTYPRPVMFRYKREDRWIDISSADAEREIDEIACGLILHGVQPGDRVALLSENRVEWAMADLAILSVGAVCVPVYPTLLAEQVAYILTDSAPVALFCADESQVAKLDGRREQLGSLRAVFCFDPAPRPDAMSWEKLRELGRLSLDARRGELDRRRRDVDENDLATLIYTSGTTGNPKGVMLTHRNIVTNVQASLESFDIDDLDSCLSFLPLSHILERMAGQFLMLSRGVTITYAQSVETVAADMLEVRPSVMISVPRLYEKIYSRVLDAANSGSPLKRRLFFWAKGVGARAVALELAGRPVPVGLRLQRWLADRLVFVKLRARTGGRIRFFVSGGAPLAKEIAEFFHAAGITILEGYGLTESSPVIAVNTFERFRPGSVGPPIPGVEVRIAEDGEILARGPSIMRGYWKREAETAETVVDGWLHTGDIGHLDEEGFLFITDRKKDLIVTAGGKNVAPQPVENELKLSPIVSEAVLIGDRRRYLTALLVPNFETLEAWAGREGIAHADRSALLADARTRALYDELVARVNARLASFEQIKYHRLLDHEFTLEAGHLTPSLKVRRKFVAERYAALIEEMYAAG